MLLEHWLLFINILISCYILYYLRDNGIIYWKWRNRKTKSNLARSSRCSGRSASTEDRLHGSRSSVDARRLFLLPVITRYTHADSISTNSNAYLPIVFLAHTYSRDFACLCGVTRPCVIPPASTRGDVCTLDDHARLRKVCAWLGGLCLSRIYYEFSAVFQRVSHSWERVCWWLRIRRIKLCEMELFRLLEIILYFPIFRENAPPD